LPEVLGQAVHCNNVLVKHPYLPIGLKSKIELPKFEIKNNTHKYPYVTFKTHFAKSSKSLTNLSSKNPIFAVE